MYDELGYSVRMVLVVPEQSQRPYRFGMTLLCVGALFNWLGLADTYSDPVPAIRYIGVGLIAAGASLICMAMCFWMRNIHDPNGSGDYNVSPDPIHVISSDPSLEKPPEYSAVVDFPPCYEDAIKLNSTPIVYRLKQALSANMHVLSQNLPDTGSDISPSSKNNNAQSDSSQHVETRASDCVDFCVTTSTNQTQVGKSAETSSQNSSQNENTFAKVFRKSIRGIRRLRSGSEDSIGSNSTGQPSNLECGHQLPERTFDESAKIDR